MKPNQFLVIGDRKAPGYLENIPFYYFGEIFIHPISYDLEVLDQYYISNFCRLYSCYAKRLMSGFLDASGYIRYNISLGNGKNIIYWSS